MSLWGQSPQPSATSRPEGAAFQIRFGRHLMFKGTYSVQCKSQLYECSTFLVSMWFVSSMDCVQFDNFFVRSHTEQPY